MKNKNIDSIVFLDCNKQINIVLKDGSNRDFVVALNFSTGLFYKILSVISVSSNEDKEITDFEKIYIVNSIVAELLKCPLEWVAKYIDFEKQLKLIEDMLNSLTGIFEREFLNIPDIKPQKEKPNSKNKEANKRYKERLEIERLTNILKKHDDNYLMDEIALILTKTNNTYSEIMAMPILIFKDLVKTIILNELRSDTDFNLAYLKSRVNKLQKDLNSGDVKTNTKPSAPKNKGANIKDLLISE